MDTPRKDPEEILQKPQAEKSKKPQVGDSFRFKIGRENKEIRLEIIGETGDHFLIVQQGEGSTRLGPAKISKLDFLQTIEALRIRENERIDDLNLKPGQVLHLGNKRTIKIVESRIPGLIGYVYQNNNPKSINHLPEGTFKLFLKDAGLIFVAETEA